MAANRLLVNRYQLLGVVGNGNYGQVFEALDTQNNQKVAVKALFPEVLSNPDLMKIVQMEIQLLTKINHRYIVKILDHFNERGQYFLVYEFCEKGDLKMAVDQKGRLSENDSLKIIYQLSEALCELQRNHIIHRDIKPENIFLTQDICKLGDFGLCYIGDRVQLNASVGSLGFLAPETQSMLIYSSKADVYSLGICFYEMIHGDIPFTQEQIGNLLEIKLGLKIERPPHIKISDFGLNLMRRMVEPNEQLRIECSEIREMLAPMFPSFQVNKQAFNTLQSVSNGAVRVNRESNSRETPPPRSLAQSKNTYSCVNILSDDRLPASRVSVSPLIQKSTVQPIEFNGAIHPQRLTTPLKGVTSEVPKNNISRILIKPEEPKRFDQMSSPVKRINQELLPNLQRAIENSRRQTAISSQGDLLSMSDMNGTSAKKSNGDTSIKPSQSYNQQSNMGKQKAGYVQFVPQLTFSKSTNDLNNRISNELSGISDAFEPRNSVGVIEKTVSTPYQVFSNLSSSNLGPTIQISSNMVQPTLSSPAVPMFVSNEYEKHGRESIRPVIQPTVFSQSYGDHQRTNSVSQQTFTEQASNKRTLDNISKIIDAFRIENRRCSLLQENYRPSQPQAPEYPAQQQQLISN